MKKIKKQTMKPSVNQLENKLIVRIKLYLTQYKKKYLS